MFTTQCLPLHDTLLLHLRCIVWKCLLECCCIAHPGIGHIPIVHAVSQTERSVRKENNDKVKELEHALAEARTELQAEKLLLQQVSIIIS